ncbi:O-antigen/teichoic acid export membrane protein [Luteibacter jiangsuensis]|uniref:O-antigen/teichoic acid export membrane protein n=1 Tax=Luteibacter jiangsuensis TaxID=637577 RepID=A0ABT9SYU1_9GAMM|nr:lipopolysaccharide biosynthesis protein [Luteibacter jiangsuensis]MDQ0010173.1 O-antigen/teichoic acid export membrane protein [Luteibacter jiangsuensis]
MSVPNAVKHATRWSGLEIGVRYLLQFGVTVVLAHLVDPSAYGVVAMVLVFTALGNVFVDSGTGLALIQRQRTSADEETSAFVINLFIATIAMGALIAASHAISSFYGRPEIAAMCIVLSAVFPLNALAVVPDALLTQQLRFKIRTRVEVGSSLASGAVAILFAMAGAGPWALVAQAISSIGMRAFMLFVASGWRPVGRYRNKDALSIFSFGGYMLAAGLIDTAYNRLQAVVIGRWFTARDLGFYSLAQNTQQAPTSFAAALLTRLGLPLLSAARHDLTEVKRVHRAALFMSLFAFVPLMIVLAVYASPIVTFVYGSRWAPAGPLLSILALGAIPWPAHVLSLVALNAMGEPRLVLRVEVAKKSLAIALLLASAPWGITAIAWSTVATSAASYLLNAYFVGTRLRYDATAQARDLLPTLLVAGCTTVVAVACAAWLPASWMGIGTGIGLALLVHVAVGWVASHPAISGFLQLIPSRIR